MAISDQILDKVYGFELSTGKQASCVYLGESQYTALKLQADQISQFGCTDQGLKFSGLDVFVVRSKDHLNVA